MKINKLLAIVVYLLTIMWVPQAKAIPAFARQTNMACAACHYQHFPVLTAFGRAFKEGGFTMTGVQEKLEANDLSLPATLNAAIVLYSSFEKTNGSPGGSTATSKNANDGSLQIPSSASVFFGGRVGEHIGFEAELNIYPTPAGLLNAKIPFVFDLGPTKVGAVAYSTAVYGPSFGLEVMNTGANAVHLFNQQSQQVISAQQYINTGMPAEGVDLIASNNWGFAVLGKWRPDQNSSSGAASGNYLRLATLPANLIPGFDFGVGMQTWTGSGASTGNIQGVVGSGAGFIQNPLLPNAPNNTTATPYQPIDGIYGIKARAVDAQLLGDVYGFPMTLITSYAQAPSNGAPTGILNGFQGNVFNPGTATRKSFNIGMELGVIPDRMTLQFGLRRAKSGFAIPSTPIDNATDNAVMLGGTYNLAMNVRMDLTYARYSGDLYGTASQSLQLQNLGLYNGNRALNLTLVAAF